RRTDHELTCAEVSIILTRNCDVSNYRYDNVCDRDYSSGIHANNDARFCSSRWYGNATWKSIERVLITIYGCLVRQSRPKSHDDSSYSCVISCALLLYED